MILHVLEFPDARAGPQERQMKVETARRIAREQQEKPGNVPERALQFYGDKYRKIFSLL